MDGLLIVNFGTSHPDSWEKTYGAMLRDALEMRPGVSVRQAVTSGMIRKKLAERGVETQDVSAALRKMEQDGISKVLVLPTFIIAGREYDRLLEECRCWAGRFGRFQLLPPLLDRPSGLERAAKAVLARQGEIPGDTALVLLGHGTDHRGDFAYPALECAFRELGQENVLVGTVEGYQGLASVRRRLETLSPRSGRVVLRPFLFTAGDHAKNDMAGEDGGSWKSVLTKDGFQVMSILEGLGEIPAIREMLLDPARTPAYEQGHSA